MLRSQKLVWMVVFGSTTSSHLKKNKRIAVSLIASSRLVYMDSWVYLQAKLGHLIGKLYFYPYTSVTAELINWPQYVHVCYKKILNVPGGAILLAAHT